MSASFVRGHRVLRLVLAALALGAGLAVFFCSRPVYYSRALVRVDDAANSERVRAVARELTQPQVIERTSGRLGAKVSATELQRSYLFNTTAKPVAAREIEVEVCAYSRDWAERWCEALVSEYLDFQRARRRKEALDTVRLLNKDLAEIAEKFGNAGAGKFEATDKAGLAQELALIDELRNPAREIAPLSKRIDELSGVRAQFAGQELSIVEKLSLLATIERATDGDNADAASGWESLEQRRRPLVELRDAMDFAGIAPEAMSLAIGDQIAELDAKLQAEFDTNFHRFDVGYRNLVDHKAALEAKAVAPASAADAATNLRLGHIAERIASLGVVKPADRGDPAFAGIRELPERPVSPRILKIALLSLLAGGVLSFGAPLLAARFGPGRLKIAQLETRLGTGSLGSIPAIPNLPPRNPALANANDARLAPLAESFRAIRGMLLADGAVPRVLLVTSAMPGEGKTIVAANLGITFAESGARTLVMDTDLRRGRLHRLFGYRPTPGLSGLLTGELSLQQTIRDTPHENLRVINAGLPPAPGGDPFASDAFADVIAKLRESFDLVIFDAPPVLGLQTTALLAPLVDAGIIVVSPDQAPPNAARAAIDLMRGSGVKVRGFVVNRAPG